MKGLERMDNQTLQNKIRGSLIGGQLVMHWDIK